MVLDLLWPDADPSAAANSLNQTVFQLRRAIDPDYRDGESASYITSNVDLVQLNAELVVTDLAEFRRLASDIPDSPAPLKVQVSSALIELIRGEFLAELRYEDWVARLQQGVHAEVRTALLRLANGELHTPTDLAVRAAASLLELDAYDEAAQVALAEQLAEGGRRVAAKLALARFAKRLEMEELGEPVTPELAELMEANGLLPNKSNRT
jgi:DNA-binding SARP family transcriptional activator